MRTRWDFQAVSCTRSGSPNSRPSSDLPGKRQSNRTRRASKRTQPSDVADLSARDRDGSVLCRGESLKRGVKGYTPLNCCVKLADSPVTAELSNAPWRPAFASSRDPAGCRGSGGQSSVGSDRMSTRNWGSRWGRWPRRGSARCWAQGG
jgi:hypothetical protein